MSKEVTAACDSTVTKLLLSPCFFPEILLCQPEKEITFEKVNSYSK